MRKVREESGASAVEFAIVSTVLFLVLFGIIQFGMAFNRSQGLEAAAREGGRLAATGATYSEIATRVRESQSLFTSSDVVVTTTPASSGSGKPCSSAGIGGLVTVTATVPPGSRYAIAIPLWGNRQINYTASGVFRCERSS